MSENNLEKYAFSLKESLNLQDVFEALAKELDFENEGKNGEQCAEDLKKYEYVYVPKIYWDFSSKVVSFYSKLEVPNLSWNVNS